ncbi:MAG: ribosome silencing factor [Epulopiscium sp.]|nr:ribosome silencing factor [Candidatus Epulonipiscium sp.]
MSKQAKEILEIAYHTLEDRQGEDIRILDIHEISILTDYFIIVHGNNVNHVRALVDYVIEELDKFGYPLVRREGSSGDSWVLLDYGNVIIHVFEKKAREFYDLERIWSDGKEITKTTVL